MIEARSITKRYGDFTAIEDITLTVGPSSIYGLAGYNGAGKTTLIKTLAGIYKPESGGAYIDGQNTFDNNTVRDRLFYVPDELFFLPYATMDTMAKFYRGYYPDFSAKRYEKLKKVFELNGSKRLRSFSKGMKRQAEIIFALSVKPTVILLDESFDGLDPQKRSIVKELLLEYIAESEVSILISSHNLSELSDVSDHIGLIKGKALIVDSPTDDISERYRRFCVVFDKEINADIFENIDRKGLKIIGKGAQLIASEDLENIRDSLNQMNPVSVEENTLSLEEIFLFEMEDSTYDFSEFFNEE
ncbi:MAG: ABC transporter ATP-binding protein [Eubacteriales bacterium]|nr:ABC transporter ATP-binding protein [Eubacteriales bacterium]MDD4421922.1 ABC transporter ATP-binding protein [Eubacteriales bacterium]